jgi:spermidine synthase
VRRGDLVFLTSGVAGLVYQVAWARLATRTLGGDTFGAALVIATFMGGMALGAWLAGRSQRLATHPRPERLFAALVTLGAATAAAGAPWLGFAAGPSRTLDALLTVAAIGPTTAVLGATFPLLGRLLEHERASLGARTGDFYGANTLGAALGALLATFAILPHLGLRGALFAGAGLDLLAAAGALLWLGPRSRAPAVPAAAPAPAAPVPAGPVPAQLPQGTLGGGRLSFGLALLGASSLALEVVLTRLLVNFTGASVYALGLVLTAYLVGLGLGARQGRSWLGGDVDAPRLLRRCAAGAVALACVGLLLLGLQLGSGDVFAPLGNRAPKRGDLWLLWLSQAVLAGLVLVPPAIAFGLALPAAVASAAAVERRGESRLLARLYAWNTVGAAAGAVLAAWWLLPQFGLRGATLAALLPALGAWLLFGPAALKERALTGALLALLLALAFGRRDSGTLAVVERVVGPISTALVERVPGEEGERLALRIDGKVVASTAPVDLRLQRLLAAIPAALHGEVESALVIGLGMGTTAGALAQLESLERLEVVELSSAVVALAPHFRPWTGALLEDPRVQLLVGDGRAFAARAAAPGGPRYDLVTADPIHPWTRGSSDLYSVEHFARLRRLLTPGGVASQWLPLYQLSTADLRTVIATWFAVFEDASAWLTAYDLVLVGSAAGRFDLEALAARELPAGLAPCLAELGVRRGSDLAALLVADAAALRAFAGATRPMGEDRPTLEFSAPRSFLAGYSTEVMGWSRSALPVERLPAAARPEAERIRGLLGRFLADAPRDWQRAAAEYGRALVEGGPAAAAAGEGL